MDAPTSLKIVATLDHNSAVGIGVTETDALRALIESGTHFANEISLIELCVRIQEVLDTSSPYAYEEEFEHARWSVHLYWGGEHVP